MPTTEIIRCLKRYVARELFPHILATAEHHATRPQPAAHAA
jgi:hypothetical protein